MHTRTQPSPDSSSTEPTNTVGPNILPSAQVPWLLIGGVAAGVAMIIIAIIAVIIVVCCLKAKSKNASSHERFYDYPYGATAQTDDDSSDAEMNRYRIHKSVATKRNEAYHMKTRRSLPFEEDEHIYDKLHYNY